MNANACEYNIHKPLHQLPNPSSSPEFFRPSNFNATKQVFEQLAILAAGAYLVLDANGLRQVLGVLLTGFGLARNLEVVHECIHETLFSGSLKVLHKPIGTIFAVPMGVSLAFWKFTHMEHHKDVRTEGFSYALDRLATPTDWLRHLLMLDHWRDAVRRLKMAVISDYTGMKAELATAAHYVPRNPRVIKYAQRDYQIVALFSGAIVATLFFKPYMIPAVMAIWIVASVIHALIELPEHINTDINSENPLRNSRHIQAGAIGRWISLNDCYHAAHHALAMLPVAKLHHLNGVVEMHASFITTYPQFYYDTTVGLWKLWRARKAAR